ncbi:hypothetical protein DFS34DRAFT_644066 [Phlyctochytrium arcticum]|nr:hypothetical protein DFS34DRAFT_644066 [Phlyctochytrium arcticum]
MGASTVGLPVDIILAISLHISDDTSTLLKCIRICRSWRSAIEPLLYRQVSFRTKRKFELFLNQLIQKKHLGQYVQSVTLTDNFEQRSRPDYVACLWKLCPNLKVFVSVLTASVANDLAQNYHVMKFAEFCPQAQVIAIAPATMITDMALLAIAANRPHLCSLDLSWAKKVGDEAWMKLVDSCPRLEKLNLSRTDLWETHIKKLRKHVPPKLQLVYFPESDDDEGDSDEMTHDDWWKNNIDPGANYSHDSDEDYW